MHYLKADLLHRTNYITDHVQVVTSVLHLYTLMHTHTRAHTDLLLRIESERDEWQTDLERAIE